VAAYVESHAGSKRDSLPERENSKIFRKLRSSKWGNLPEMDIDAVICSQARIALVDELAIPTLPVRGTRSAGRS